MKKKTVAILLCLILVFSPITAFAFSTSSSFNSKKYNHQSRFAGYEIKEGLDVSYHNGEIDWTKIKNAGTDFVIIRAGYRGYGEKGSLCKDTQFAQNMNGAKSVGIPRGVYIYSQAVTKAEAIEEANFVLNMIKEYTIEMPIVFDYEFAGVSTGRLDSAWKSKKIKKADMTANTLAFCNTIKAAGYEAMVYANKSFLNENIDHKAIENAGYRVWLAHYTTNTDYDGEFDIWQYTSTGEIKTIKNKVFDCNFMYCINDLPDQMYTGEAVVPDIKVEYNGTVLMQGTDYTLTFENNVDVGTAKAIVTGIGDYENKLLREYKFKIVPGKVVDIKASSITTTSLNLSWTPAKEADGYYIQMLKNGVWTNITSQSSTTRTITGLSAGCSYQFRVYPFKAVNGETYCGGYSNELKTATLMGNVNITSSTSASKSITLNWKKQTAVSGYQIYRYNSSKKAYVLVASTNKTSYTVKGLAPNTKYKFKVRAYINKTYGPYGTVLTTYTSSAAPTIKSAISPSSRKLKVSWKKMSGATGFQVMWSTTSKFTSNYKTANNKSAKAVSKTVTTGQSKKTYYVKVRSYKKRDGKNYYSDWSKTLKIKVK